MNITDATHELLEEYWVENKEKNNPWGIRASSHPEAAAELIKGGFSSPAGADDGILELTAKGWGEASHCVRRHRLAERLMADVLNMANGAVHEAACRFEHVLLKDVESNICALLGHPNECPHGKPIPEGECCVSDHALLRKMILPLSECEPGEVGKIAYVKSRDLGAMDKLSVMGILPGLSVKLLRTSPSCLFQMGESQFAIDRKMAGRIYIRLAGVEAKAC